MPNHVESIEKQYNEMKMGFIIPNEVAAELVRAFNTSPFGQSQISQGLIEKMSIGTKNLTHEESRLAASPRFMGNRCENVLNYFFPDGEFHNGK